MGGGEGGRHAIQIAQFIFNRPQGGEEESEKQREGTLFCTNQQMPRFQIADEILHLHRIKSCNEMQEDGDVKVRTGKLHLLYSFGILVYLKEKLRMDFSTDVRIHLRTKMHV